MQRRLLITGTLVALSCAFGTARATAAGDDPGCTPTAGSPTQSQRLTDEQRYIDWVASATPEELYATFGR